MQGPKPQGARRHGQRSPRAARAAREPRLTPKVGRSTLHAGHSRLPRLTEQRSMKGARKDERTASRSPVPVASGVLAVSMTELGEQPWGFSGEVTSWAAAQ